MIPFISRIGNIKIRSNFTKLLISGSKFLFDFHFFFFYYFDITKALFQCSFEFHVEIVKKFLQLNEFYELNYSRSLEKKSISSNFKERKKNFNNHDELILRKFMS